ncbi:MAG: methylaspartate mutase subunit S [Salinirussus sp.]
MVTGTVVTGVIGSDVHSMGIQIIEYALEDAGFDVVSLGVQTPQREFIDAAIETDADALIISSVYGHARLDCDGLRDKCDEAGLEDILLYVGGNLAVSSETTFEEARKEMRSQGFDRVYPSRADIPDMIEDLKADVKDRRAPPAQG